MRSVECSQVLPALEGHIWMGLTRQMLGLSLVSIEVTRLPSLGSFEGT